MGGRVTRLIEPAAPADYPAEADVRDGTDFDNAEQTGTLDLPAVGDVRAGTTFDGESKEGTCAIPTAANVRNGTAVDDTTGTLDLPAEADVKAGVKFDGETKTGSYPLNKDPAAGIRMTAPANVVGNTGAVTLYDPPFAGSIDMSDMTGITQLFITYGPAFSGYFRPPPNCEEIYLDQITPESLDLSALDSLLKVYLDNMPDLDSVTWPDTPILTHIDFDIWGSTDFTSLSVAGFTTLNAMSLTSNAFCLTLNASGCTNLASLQLNSTFENVNLTGAGTSGALLSGVYCSGCNLTEASVDNILAACVAAGYSGGYCDLSGGGSAPPSAPGLANKAILEADSWTVLVNS